MESINQYQLRGGSGEQDGIMSRPQEVVDKPSQLIDEEDITKDRVPDVLKIINQQFVKDMG